MDALRLFALGPVVVAVMWSPGAANAQATDSLPPGVTRQMVATGQTVFRGPGLCHACHGQDAKGVRGVGPDLTDGEWLHSDGSYQGILQTIIKGVLPNESKTGGMMPPKGGANITDEQLQAVAAYVWSLRSAAGPRR